MLDRPEMIKGGISAGWGLIGVVAGSWRPVTEQENHDDHR